MAFSARHDEENADCLTYAGARRADRRFSPRFVRPTRSGEPRRPAQRALRMPRAASRPPLPTAAAGEATQLRVQGHRCPAAAAKADTAAGGSNGAAPGGEGRGPAPSLQRVLQAPPPPLAPPRRDKTSGRTRMATVITKYDTLTLN